MLYKLSLVPIRTSLARTTKKNCFVLKKFVINHKVMFKHLKVVLFIKTIVQKAKCIALHLIVCKNNALLIKSLCGLNKKTFIVQYVSN